MTDPFTTSYEPFSREPEYIDLNRRFVESLGLSGDQPILELACGTATVTEQILKVVSGARIVGLDLSRESLTLGQKHLAAVPGGASVVLVEASADSMPIASASVGAIVMGNSVQLVDDKDRLFEEARRVLTPRGLFACNTSFYAGTYVPGTERFYTRWVVEAANYVKRKSDEGRAQGLAGIARKRGAADRAFSRPWLSARAYCEFLERHGFTVRSVFERTVMLDQRCFETIGSYAGLAGVLLSGYPVALACEALERAAGPALSACGLTEVPRYWLEIAAVRG